MDDRKKRYKVIRSSTIPLSLNVLLRGQLKFLNQYFQMTAVSGAGDDLEAVKLREEVKVEPISMERKIAPLKDLVSLVKLYFFFKKHKPHIVHSITPKAGLLSMMAAWMAGVPIRMHTFTGLIFPTHTGKMQQLLILMDRLLCSFATNIYPEGEGVKNDLIRFGITRKPLKVLAKGNVNGVDLNHFNPELSPTGNDALRDSLGLTADNFVFVYVGRITGDKGINELITGFVMYQSTNVAARLLLVGSAEGESDTLHPDTLVQIQTNKAIIAAGFQADIRPYLAISQVLVLASYREGFPNVVLQAGAMGLPAIVTDINGSNEIICNRKNGIIIPAKDSLAIVQAMGEIVDDPTLYLTMKTNSRKMIADRFDQQVVWAAILQEYNAALENIETSRLEAGA